MLKHVSCNDSCTVLTQETQTKLTHLVFQWARQAGWVKESLLNEEFTEASGSIALGILLTASFTAANELEVGHSNLHVHVCQIVKGTRYCTAYFIKRDNSLWAQDLS